MKSSTNFGGVECPVCHMPTGSGQHEQQCGRGATTEVIQVSPPECTKRRGAENHDSVEAEAFPIVSAAHEFKTPLVVMLGYTDLLRNGQLGPVNERQREVLEEIQQSGQRLQKLIQDLLLLSELRASAKSPQMQPETEPAEINEDLKQIFDYWTGRARQKGLQYRLTLPEGNPRVGVDSLRLQHIISNLIENALKYTPAKGRVTVSATQCFWDRRKAQSEFLFNLERRENRKIKNAIRIDVSDTGPGIPHEYREAIFGDFIQLRGASSTGTGLGLAIARRLVESYGGLIWVESKPEAGSTFSVLLSQIR
ncbi:MAG TPA: HAMP domain-containing sensor histidine kinase [Candidatus Angelobacter sp.]|jgi:signal transduction histidine kinase|nr:HAMP domain-containing sensor histidine kinase [Candidatus Angelobacter sp.]